MRTIVQLITHKPDAWTETVLEQENLEAGIQIRRVDLRGAEPRYDDALDEILRADAVQIF